MKEKSRLVQRVAWDSNGRALPIANLSIVENAKDFGRAVKEARRAVDLSQVQLATAAGVGERFIVNLEHGKPTSEIGKALAVARALGLEISVGQSRPALAVPTQPIRLDGPPPVPGFGDDE